MLLAADVPEDVKGAKEAELDSVGPRSLGVLPLLDMPAAREANIRDLSGPCTPASLAQ